ncbi:MAG TPA: hypothetical protein VG410_11575 [Solirubrobacteraceae bacterium]|jgi:hypothetical protein|nr:hypothetical protein [Solirubrobacteraceae bacterium]
MEHGTIRIHTSFFFLQFLFFFFKPTISIDGAEPQKYSWGESEHQVSPGPHTVNIEIPYFFTKVGKANVPVDVAADQTVTISYKPPFLVTMQGRVTVS